MVGRILSRDIKRRDFATSANININDQRPLSKQMPVVWHRGRLKDTDRERRQERDEKPQRLTDQLLYNALAPRSRESTRITDGGTPHK